MKKETRFIFITVNRQGKGPADHIFCLLVTGCVALGVPDFSGGNGQVLGQNMANFEGVKWVVYGYLWPKV